MSKTVNDYVEVPVLKECPSEFSKTEIKVIAEDEQYMIEEVVDKMRKNRNDRHSIYYFAQGIE